MKSNRFVIVAFVLFFVVIAGVYYYAFTNNLVVTMSNGGYSILCNGSKGPSHPGGGRVEVQVITVKKERPDNCSEIPALVGDILISTHLAKSGPVY